MSELKVTGTITKVLEVEKGTSKAGKEWQKLSFILDTKTEYNNIYCFEMFGEEKVNQFNQYNKVGDEVEVSFNVSTNEWKDKYFTSLSAWRVFKATAEEQEPAQQEPAPVNADESDDDLPF
tara:strand:- start:1071 stop:1433 length:363 start_codon:yes stop_codon:yes gene_type:complete